jgi:hypothetical protein
MTSKISDLKLARAPMRLSPPCLPVRRGRWKKKGRGR